MIDIVLITSLVASIFWMFCGFDEVLNKYLANRAFNGAPRAEFRAMASQIRNWSAFVFVVYSALMTISPWKATLGKLLFGMQVVNAETEERLDLWPATKRTAGLLFGALSAIRQALSSSGQIWHDKIAGSKVVKIHQPF